MLKTLAELLRDFQEGKITREEWVHRYGSLCTGCNKPLEQSRIPLEERYIMGQQPDKCSDCYEKAVMSYVAAHYERSQSI